MEPDHTLDVGGGSGSCSIDGAKEALTAALSVRVGHENDDKNENDGGSPARGGPDGGSGGGPGRPSLKRRVAGGLVVDASPPSGGGGKKRRREEEEGGPRIEAVATAMDENDDATAIAAATTPQQLVTAKLRSRGYRTAIEHYSLDTAYYFATYREGTIGSDVMAAVRTQDIGKLREIEASAVREKEEEAARMQKRREAAGGFSCGAESCLLGLEARRKRSNSTSSGNGRPRRRLSEQRNILGESLLHLAARWALGPKVVEFLVGEAAVPLNVRDQFGRTPLHYAVSARAPDWDLVHSIITRRPELVLFEDNFGKRPFSYVNPIFHRSCIEFLNRKDSWMSGLDDKYKDYSGYD